MSLISYLKKLNWVSSDSPIQTDINKWEKGISDCVDELNNNCLKADGSRPLIAEQKGVDPTSTTGLTTKQYVDNGDSKSIIQIGTCSTASATAEKVVTLGIKALTNGLTFLVSMTNANTSATITFNVDGLGAKNVYDKRGTQITGTLFSNTANEKVLLRYNSTLDGFELLTADFWTSRMSAPSDVYIEYPLSFNTCFGLIAPADGYAMTCGMGSNNSQAVVSVSSYKSTTTTDTNIIQYNRNDCYTAGQGAGVSIRVRKGQYIIFFGTFSTNIGRFIYAEGSKP